MKTTRNVLFALLLLGSTAAVASASTAVSAGIHVGPSGHTSVDLGFFYDDLAPYGNWIERPSYGWVWTPRAVSTSWRPYQNGHWVWSDEGWVWVSDEPYGWATYHYGRWYDDPEIGWAWVPGDDWGPAWVSWQGNDDYVGWAPLPPGVNVSVSYGSGYGSYAYGIAPDYYNFVPERYFLSSRVATYVVPQAQIYNVWGGTRNWTRYRRSGDRWFNQGVPVDRIQRFARVPRYQVADLRVNDAGFRHRGARFAGSQVQFFRPQIQKARVTAPVSRPAARRAVVTAAQFKAANPARVARMNQRVANRQAQVNQRQVAQRQVKIDQKQVRLQQQQAKIAKQQVKVDRRQQQAQVRGRDFGQQRKVAAQQQRQVRVDQRQARVQQKQANVARQQVRMDRRQMQAQSHGRGPAVRQQKSVAQRQQARVDRKQVRVQQRQANAARQQVRADRQQARANRQPARAQRQQGHQRPPQGGGRQHGQGGGGGNPHHQRGGGHG